jgi:hypothetical protein
MRSRRAHPGQVLVFFALVLPIVLVPVAAYAVDAAVSESAFARLEEVTATAAQEAAEQVDQGKLRAGEGLALDPVAASAVAGYVVASEDQAARVLEVRIEGATVTVVCAVVVSLPLNFVGSPAVTMRASASARLAGGYDRPSSRLPLPVSTF